MTGKLAAPPGTVVCKFLRRDSRPRLSGGAQLRSLCTRPRHLALVLLKIILAACRPARGQLHRRPRTQSVGRILRALVKGHDDVSPQPDLRLHGLFGTKKVRRTVQVRAKRHAFFADLAEIGETENLKPARIRKDGAIPRHEPMQPAHPANRLDPRPQEKMVGIREQNLDAEFFQHILRDALHRSEGPDRHEHRSLDLSVRSNELARTGGTAASFNLQANRHRGIVTDVRRRTSSFSRGPRYRAEEPRRCTSSEHNSEDKKSEHKKPGRIP